MLDTVRWTVEAAHEGDTVERLVCNLEIICKLLKYVVDNPTQRFGQILRNAGVIVDFQRPPANPGDWNEVEWTNHFNEESKSTLVRMDKTEREKV